MVKKTLVDDELKGKDSYTADDISVLEGLDPVRKRPGMYIGSTDTTGLHHLIKEIFDNSRDEAMAGHCDHIEITLLPNGAVRVADNGRGIPVDKHKQSGVSALETILTVLHAGGKFGGESSGYKVSGGLHGVGASVVNALSTDLRACVFRDGGMFVQEYQIGKPKSDIKKVAKSEKRGTIITFKPDDSIFDTIHWHWSQIVSHYRSQAYLVPGVKVVILDARKYEKKIDHESVQYLREEILLDVPSETFYFEGGIKAMLAHTLKGSNIINSTPFYTKKTVDNVHIEIALQYSDDVGAKIFGYANNIVTPGGGSHITGFKSALTRLMNAYNKKNKILPEKEGSFMGEDLLEGIVAIVSVKMGEIQFEGQTKDKLGSVEAKGAVEQAFGEAFDIFLEEHPEDAKQIFKKVMLAFRARKAAKAAKDSIMRKGALEGAALPGKLTDCQTKRSDEAELFIVEGDSAGGTAKQGRDRRTQAILALRGKPLNVEKKRLGDILENQEIKNLIIAMGTSIGETFNLDNIRYKKIILATDADVDGKHIQTLLMTLFFRYFPEIVRSGFLYLAQPPLYKITKGKQAFYAFSDEEKLEITNNLGGMVSEQKEDVGAIEDDEKDETINEEQQEKNSKKSEKQRTQTINIQRYKGLGEMNAEQLWETTMDPNSRTLKQIVIEDAEECDKIFKILMGSGVEDRKAFIVGNANMVEVDI
jgi:DNA gyrase subunit B